LTYEGENILQHIVFGISDTDDEKDGVWRPLARSANVTVDDAAILNGSIPVTPPISESDHQVGLFKGSNRYYILARTYSQNNGERQPRLQCILLPQETLQTHIANIKSLLESLGSPPDIVEDEPLQSIEIPSSPTWTADMRQVIFDRLLSGDLSGGMETLIFLLSAALSKRKLLIQGYQDDLATRLDLVQGIILLLPPVARTNMTFSTHAADSQDPTARIIFADDVDDSERIIVNIAEGKFPQIDNLRTPYIESLYAMWNNDTKIFIEDLRAMERLASVLMADKPLLDGLNAIAERQTLDIQVLTTDKQIPADQLKAVLLSEIPPVGPLRLRYLERLLEYSLAERDIDAVNIVARNMEEDPEIDEALRETLTADIEDSPDAVYFFIRTHLGDNMDERWLPLLKSAAVVAMQVVIDEGDSEVILHWMQLIAREPDAYQLDEVLRNGVLAAQEHAHENGDLGSHLLVFTARRAPDLIKKLLADKKFVSALTAPVGTALRDFEQDAVAETMALGREIGLVTLARAAETAPKNEAAAGAFTAEAINQLWSWLRANNAEYLPEKHRPASVIRQLASTGATWLHPDARVAALAHIMIDDNQDLLREFSVNLAAHEALYPALYPALQASGAQAETVYTIINALLEDESVNPQQAADTYLRLAAHQEWATASALGYVEQVTRLGQQASAPIISLEDLWRMLDMTVEAKSELPVRVILRQILGYIEQEEDETSLASMLVRLYDRLKSNKPARATVINWWREFMVKQGLVRLQQLDRALEGAKALEEARAMVRTSVAVRRLLGRRSLEEFAESIGMAYTILQALSDSFDPVNKMPVSFDQSTVRAELDALEDNMAPDQRSILAKNLKELAQLVIMMAEHRSKAGIIRSEDNIERQLLTGEQQPQSAIDTMKWLSGYLDGMQDNGGDSE
jgi:hypothetical protein